MRFVVLALLAAGCIAAPARAQTGAWAAKLFDKTSHDFGTCPRGAQLKHRFKIKNIYKVPLEITNIRPSCSCLTFQQSTKVIPPRGEAYIDVNMDARAFPGFKSIVLYVTFGPEYVSTASIQITATARQDVVFNPGSISFGVVQRGQTPTKVLDVEYSGALDWRIKEIIKSRSAPFDIKVKELYRKVGRFRHPNQIGYRFTVTLRENAKPGHLKQTMLIKTNDPQTRNFTVCIEGNIQANLAVSPSRLDLGTVKVKQEVTQKIIVRSPQSFRIESIDGIEKKGASIATVLPKRNARFHVISLHFQPGQAGRFEKQLTIRTDIGETATVTVVANVVP